MGHCVLGAPPLFVLCLGMSPLGLAVLVTTFLCGVRRLRGLRGLLSDLGFIWSWQGLSEGSCLAAERFAQDEGTL